MISQTSTNYAGNSGKVGFGFNLAKTHKKIVFSLVNPDAIKNSALVEDTLVKLGKKVEKDNPKFTNSFSLDVPLQVMDKPEAALQFQLWNHRLIAEKFIKDHLKQIRQTAINIMNISSKPASNLINKFKMKMNGISIVKKSDKKTVSFSKRFIKKYLNACQNLVKNDSPLDTLYNMFPMKQKNHKK